MEYVRIDENLPDHPKVLALPRALRPIALWLYLRGLCYASRLESDGLVPAGICESDADDEAARALCEVGLWHEAESGYEIHDFLDWNRSAAEIAEIRDKRRKAGSRGGKQRASKLLSNGEANAKQTPSKRQAKTYPKTETETKTEELAKVASSSARGDFAKVVSRLEQVTGSTLSSADQRTVNGWCNSFDTDRILAGIDKAAGKGKTRIAYIGTIIAEEPMKPTPKGKQSSDADEVYEWGDPRG